MIDAMVVGVGYRYIPDGHLALEPNDGDLGVTEAGDNARLLPLRTASPGRGPARDDPGDSVNDWKATHVVTHRGRTVRVMLTGDGWAYTRTEWADETPAPPRLYCDPCGGNRWWWLTEIVTRVRRVR